MVLMEQASKPSSLKRADGGLRCNGRDYIKQETPLEKGKHIQQKKKLKLIVEGSVLTFNEQLLLKLA